MSNSRTGGTDDITARGKYLLISVPEFGDDPINPGKKMTSYLRMGAASTTWKDDPGGSLVENVNLAGPAGGALSAAGQEVRVTGDSGDARPVFIDDTRERGAGTPHDLSVGERQTESEALHTRGGWRDHSDGNRITTTYGDKVEVIRGNYKMVVMGRQDDVAASAGWDASGAHIQDFAYTWPAFLRVEWTQQYDGVWHNQTTTDGVVTSENFGGDSYEFKWGNHFESTTGSAHPPPDLNAKPPRGNPHIIDRTWATQIESYTGSLNCRVPTIKEELWVMDKTSLTDAMSITEETRCSGTITSTTTTNASTETTTVTGEMTSNTSAGSIAETTSAGAIAGATTAATINDITTAGVITDLTVVGVKAELTVAETMVGMTVARAIGNVTLAGVHAEIEVCLGKLDVFLGGHISVALPDSLQISFPDSVGQRLAALDTSVNALSTSITQVDTSLSRQVAALRVDLGLP